MVDLFEKYHYMFQTVGGISFYFFQFSGFKKISGQGNIV